MSTVPPLEKALLKLFAEARDHKLSATSLKTKLATTAKKAPDLSTDAAEIDQAITGLIDAKKVRVERGKKDAPHPRSGASYYLTGAGKDHVKPVKPDVSDELSGNQEAYLLFQFLRIKEGGASMSRSELNGKLKTKAAREKFELEPTVNKASIDFHLHELVQSGSLEEKRQGVSTVFTLTDAGLVTLGSGKQYDDEKITFTLSGPALNKLLNAARGGATRHPKADVDPTIAAVTPPRSAHHAAPESSAIEPKQIHDFIAHLKANRYAGRDLVPIHEVRTLVAQHHGDHAASHPVFDRLLKTMRSEGELEIIAIADSRDTPQQHLDDSIPGLNEILFFIDTE